MCVSLIARAVNYCRGTEARLKSPHTKVSALLRLGLLDEQKVVDNLTKRLNSGRVSIFELNRQAVLFLAAELDIKPLDKAMSNHLNRHLEEYTIKQLASLPVEVVAPIITAGSPEHFAKLLNDYAFITEIREIRTRLSTDRVTETRYIGFEGIRELLRGVGLNYLQTVSPFLKEREFYTYDDKLGSRFEVVKPKKMIDELTQLVSSA